jgi:uncharacterized Tic20 family protein
METRIILAAIIMLHGMGHILGPLMTFGIIRSEGFSDTSWLLNDRFQLGEGVQKALSVLWIVALVGFAATAFGLWNGLGWWRTLAWVNVALSVILFATWWNAFPQNVPVQANLGNAAIVGGLLLLRSI